MVLSFQCSVRSLLLKWHVNFLVESVIYHEKQKEEKCVELKCKKKKKKKTKNKKNEMTKMEK